jgi:glycosyltransferase involved in cell wall biosynthesis
MASVENPPPKDWSATQAIQILYMSNLIRSKGYWHLLEACELLAAKGVRFHCHFCGAFKEIGVDGHSGTAMSEEERFRERLKSPSLSGLVTYHGVVRGGRKVELFEGAHVLVLPTNYPWEGQPISIIEALAFGLPVITTRYRAIPDLISDGVNGLFVDFGAPRQIAERLEYIDGNREAAARMSLSARESFKKRFSRDSHLRRMERLIYGSESPVDPRDPERA